MKGIDISVYKKPQAAPGKRERSRFEFLNKDIQLFPVRLKDKVKESFYLELSTLLQSGIDIKTAFDLILEEQSKYTAIYRAIKEEVVKGHSLSEALQRSGYFTPYEYVSVQIGEESGKIHLVLKDLAGYFQKKVRQRRQIIQAITYPSLVLITAILAIAFMLNFIVPMFADIFKRSGKDLPFITLLIVQIAAFFKQYFIYFLLFAGAAMVFTWLNKKKAWFRSKSAAFLLRIPVAGQMVQQIYLARFCQSMSLLIGARLPITKTISLVRQMIGFYPIEHALEKTEQDIIKGAALHESLASFSIYPRKMISLIKVGEEINQLDLFFEKMAQQYTDEIEYRTSVLSSLLEPFIIIFLGLIVGIILVAMYLPLFQLSTSF